MGAIKVGFTSLSKDDRALGVFCDWLDILDAERVVGKSFPEGTLRGGTFLRRKARKESQQHLKRV
jgi:hypothetical protein